MSSINGISKQEKILYAKLLPQTNNETPKLEYKPDSFEKVQTGAKQDKSNNGKFDASECLKNFAKGILSPITAVIKHPVLTVGILAISTALCTLIPVMMPIMGISFGALSVFQLGKGIYNAAKNYKNAQYDKAEKSFNEIGQGTVGVALSVLGLKQGAKIAKEAKLMNELGVNSLSAEQKAQIAKEVKEAGNLEALKEIGSLFTSKAGLKAIFSQFKPSNISQRAKDALKFLTEKEEVTKIKKETVRFEETAEGKRRAAMTSEEIEAKVRALYKEACDDYGIPEKLRPEIKVTQNDNIAAGGGYNGSTHTITINEKSYRAGVFDLPDVIKHEATHAKEAILRQRLPLEEKQKLAVEFLSDKIQNGEKEQIITDIYIGHTASAPPPKLNVKMKADFSQLAKDKLYQMYQYGDEELSAMVRPLVEKNPDFIKGYDNVDDAIQAMTAYAKSHNLRYRMAMNNSSGFNTSKIDASLLKELSPEERIAAIESFKQGVECTESNAINQKIINTGCNFDQYQFCSEEVMAQEYGNNFEIAELKKELSALKAKENYDITEEARILDQIKRAELTIEYKIKGQKMYELYTQSINHPENTELAAQVEAMQNELTQIQQEINSISCLKGDFPFSTNPRVETFEYTTQQIKQRIPTGASIGIPYNTSNAADIIADNTAEQNKAS